MIAGELFFDFMPNITYISYLIQKLGLKRVPTTCEAHSTYRFGPLSCWNIDSSYNIYTYLTASNFFLMESLLYIFILFVQSLLENEFQILIFLSLFIHLDRWIDFCVCVTSVLYMYCLPSEETKLILMSSENNPVVRVLAGIPMSKRKPYIPILFS